MSIGRQCTKSGAQRTNWTNPRGQADNSDMPDAQANHVLMLHSGGLRSEVAARLLLDEQPQPRLTLMFVRDGRANERQRLESAVRLIESLPTTNVRLTELNLPSLFGVRNSSKQQTHEPPTLAWAQLLIPTMAYAAEHRIERVVYPGSVNGDARAMAALSETLLLSEQLASVESDLLPRIETPLLELTDQQIVELGGQLDAQFKSTWTCLADQSHACGICPACKRRRDAFDRAGIEDPVHAGELVA